MTEEFKIPILGSHMTGVVIHQYYPAFQEINISDESDNKFIGRLLINIHRRPDLLNNTITEHQDTI